MKTFIESQDLKTTAPAEQRPSVSWALTGLSLSMLLSSLGTSIANVALPSLTRAFNASFQEVQWVVLAYLLAITTLIVSVGRFGDIVGRRRLLQAGILIFTLASIVGGVSTTLWMLISSRAVQGLGAAIMMALTMAFVGEIVPKEKTGSAMGLLGTMSAIGTALGPSLGGVLISGWSWRSIFFINVPLGIVALLLVSRHLPGERRGLEKKRPRLDPLGTLLLAMTLTAYALAMTLGRGQFGTVNITLLLGAAVGFALFLYVESKATSPLIQLSLFRDPRLSANLAMSGIVSTVVMTTLVVGPFYLSRALGLDSAVVGMVMSVGPLVAALTGTPAGRMVDRFGTQRVNLVGVIGMTGGCLIQSLLPMAAGIGGYVTAISIITAGYALFQTANNTAVMSTIAPENRGVISGMLNLSRNLGLITGTSVMGALFAFAAGSIHLTQVSPGDVAAGMRFTFAVAAGLSLVSLALATGSHVIARTRHEGSR
ncbi:MFS transporter [Prosthecobacter sp.]|uniref:MFS transporter n=1 Tax=Prosthecobacter sp. TaxID=1965333 RepID=UPI0037840453